MGEEALVGGRGGIAEVAPRATFLPGVWEEEDFINKEGGEEGGCTCSPPWFLNHTVCAGPGVDARDIASARSLSSILQASRERRVVERESMRSDL